MTFNGAFIKDKAKEAGLTLLQLAADLDVSRQSINSWIGGQVPRGEYLVKLCTILGIKVSDLFGDPMEGLISVPLHRTIKKRSVTQEMRDASKSLAEQYINLFRQAPTVSMVQVVRVKDRAPKNAVKVAEWLRKLSGVEDGKPMTFENAFQLLSALGIFVVFRAFPSELMRQSYAFYSRIAGQRVVFVNIDTNILDLIFQILHETVHAVQDEGTPSAYLDEEEDFCDSVAELSQFPSFYVDLVARIVADCGTNTGVLVNNLKDISRENGHSLWGIYFRLLHEGKIGEDLKIAGAATNLTKSVRQVRAYLYDGYDPRKYVDNLFNLSPRFMELISTQVPDCSVRKLGEWLGLDTSVDAQAVMEEIRRRKDISMR
jgi:transcriptional regulator with XRE-family HTH domain